MTCDHDVTRDHHVTCDYQVPYGHHVTWKSCNMWPLPWHVSITWYVTITVMTCDHHCDMRPYVKCDHHNMVHVTIMWHVTITVMWYMTRLVREMWREMWSWLTWDHHRTCYNHMTYDHHWHVAVKWHIAITMTCEHYHNMTPSCDIWSLCHLSIIWYAIITVPITCVHHMTCVHHITCDHHCNMWPPHGMLPSCDHHCNMWPSHDMWPSPWHVTIIMICDDHMTCGCGISQKQ